ncbi:hypothetical protein [Bosea massiliensis]|uniref:Uncharacterized protein n=1 Tax=Bosea massiliensis TaxID=151419 RepID=A0ABW0P9K2_9HYPH
MIGLDQIRQQFDRILAEPLQTRLHTSEDKGREIVAAADARLGPLVRDSLYAGPNRYAGIEIVTYPIGTRLRNAAGEELVIDAQSAFLTGPGFKVVS